MSYVTCQNCGRGNADIARICRYCGAQLQHGAARGATYADPQAGSYVPPHSWKSGSLPLQPQPQVQPLVSADHFRCPHCQTTAPPVVATRISTAGWVVFFALLVFCLPLCFVGLFIKEEYRQCSWCRAALS
jgi:hypothetical protein